MATTNNAFVVKNGLVVNGNLITANNGQVGINNSSPDANVTITGTANVQGNAVITGTLASANLTVTGFISSTTNVSTNSVFATNVFATTVNTTTINASATVYTNSVFATNVAATTVNTTTINASATVYTNSVFATNVAATTVNTATINASATVYTNSVFATNVSATTVNATTINATATVYTNSVFATNVSATTVTANTTGIHTGNVSATVVNAAANVFTNSVYATNVYATNLTGNLTGNVAAVTVGATSITGNLTGNVIAVAINTSTITATGLANVLSINALANSYFGNCLYVAGNLYVSGTTTTQSSSAATANIVPSTTTSFFLGNTSNVWAAMYATNVYATNINTAAIGATSNVYIGSTTNSVSIQNTSIVIGNVSVNATINSTVYTGTANNASYLGGVAAASYVNTSGSFTLSGVTTLSSNLVISAGVSANGGYGTSGQVLTSNGIVGSPYWTTISGALGFTPYNATNPSNFANSFNNFSINGSANNASYLGGVAAASYVNTSGSYTLSGIITLNSNLVITAGVSANGGYGIGGQVLTSNGTTGSPYWAAPVAAPAGSSTYVQFNDGGVTNGISSFTFTKASNTITIGNGSVSATINSTAYTGSANNATYLNGQLASYYQTALGYTAYNATNPSNFANATNGYAINGSANNATYLNGQLASYYQTALGYTAYSATNPAVFANATNGFGISGTAATANTATYLYGQGVISSNIDLQYTSGVYGFSPSTTGTKPTTGYGTVINLVDIGTTHDNNANWLTQLAFDTSQSGPYFRNKINSSAFGSWYTLLTSSNYNTYSPTLTGTGASGTWPISISYNANNASYLGGVAAGSYATITGQSFANNSNGLGINGSAGSVAMSSGRTDTAAYPVVWGTTGSTSQLYSASAVTIQSSTGTLYATTFSGSFSGSGAGLTGTGASFTAGAATLAAKSSTLASGGGNGTAMTFNWSGQGGQPTWLWGGSDGVNMYVYNPSNFSVNYATSAGSASTAGTATNQSGGSVSATTGSFSSILGVSGTFSPSGAISWNSTAGSGYSANFTMTSTGYGSKTFRVNSAYGLEIVNSAYNSVPFVFNDNGSFTATNNITAYYSDNRLKENIALISDPLEKISQIKGVTYNSNELAATFGYTDKKLQYGVLAQDIEKIMPEIVVPAPFDVEVVDGEQRSRTGENYKTVQYEKMIPLLIEAIKELKAEVDELKAKLK